MRAARARRCAERYGAVAALPAPAPRPKGLIYPTEHRATAVSVTKGHSEGAGRRAVRSARWEPSGATPNGTDATCWPGAAATEKPAPDSGPRRITAAAPLFARRHGGFLAAGHATLTSCHERSYRARGQLGTASRPILWPIFTAASLGGLPRSSSRNDRQVVAS